MAVALVWLCAWSQPAWAAPRVPRVADGEGIKVGERSVFHAGFALTFGFDSNVFFQDGAEDPTRAGYVLPSTWLGIGNREVRDGLLMTPAERSARILDYNVSVIAGFRQFMDSRIEVRTQPRFTIGTQIHLALLPGRRFSIHLDEDFFRGADSSNYATTGNEFNFNRLDHRGALSFFGRPGGGRVSLAFGYRSQYLGFSEPDLDKNNRMVNGLLHETKWRFLPKSSVLFRYTFDWTYYTQCCAEVGVGRNEDSFAHRLMGGYAGQAFEKFIFEALVGWGFGYYRDDPNGPNFNSIIGEVSMSYYPTLRSLVHLAAFRQFNDSLWGNYFVDNGARLALGHQFRWRMIGHLGFSVAGRTYSGLPVPGQETAEIVGYEGGSEVQQFQMKTVLAALQARIEQPLGRLFAVSLSYNLAVDANRGRVLYSNGITDELGYVRHLVMLLGAVRI